MSEKIKINLISIFKILWKKKIHFVTLFITFISFEILVLNLLPKNFKCEATIKILDKSEYNPIVFILEKNSQSSESTYEATAARISINSLEFIDELVVKLDLERNFNLQDIKDKMERRLVAINELKSKILIKDLQTNNILQVKVSDKDSNLAYKITLGILNLLQERKIKELNRKNDLITLQLANSLENKTNEIEKLKSKLAEIRIKYKIVSNGKNGLTEKNIPATEGLYQNIDQVFDYENQLNGLSQSLAKDKSDYLMICNFKKSNYPVYEIIEEPIIPLSRNEYNTPLIYILLFISSFIICTIFVLILEFK